MSAKEKLDMLFDYMAQKQLLEMDKQALIGKVYTPEIKNAISEIEFEFSGKSAAVDENIANLTDEIKADVLEVGCTIKGEHLSAVFSKGRISWDTKALDGVIALHPELAQFRNEGDPSISIRRLG